MSRINVKRKDLIEVLKANRDTHASEYEEAYLGYKQLCVEALQAKLEQINANDEFDMYFNDLMSAPENHVEDYQDVIEMLELSEDDKLSIGMDEYKKYYKNDWSWSHNWGLSNKMYVDKFHDM